MAARIASSGVAWQTTSPPNSAAAMMAAMVRGRGQLVPVAVGAGAALAVTPLAGNGWGIVAAGLAGAAVAALTARPGVLR